MNPKLTSILKSSSLVCVGLVIGAFSATYLEQNVSRPLFVKLLQSHENSSEEFRAARAKREGKNLEEIVHRWNVAHSKKLDLKLADELHPHVIEALILNSILTSDHKPDVSTALEYGKLADS